MNEPNPQLEDGHIRIANPIWTSLMKFKLSDYERRVVMAVIYRTYGFNKLSAKITNKQLVKDTGISRQNVNKTLNLLEEKKLVVRTDYKIKFNKVYTEWKTCSPMRLQKTCSPTRLQSESVQTTVVVQSDYTDRCVKTPLKDNIKNTVVLGVFEFWNLQEIVKHRKLTSEMKTKIKKRLKDYSAEEIKEAIAKYAAVLKDDKYVWSYKWTLDEFLQRGFVKFLEKSSDDFQKAQDDGLTDIQREWLKRNDWDFMNKYGDDKFVEVGTSLGKL